MGLRQKIIIGFCALALLLTFSGFVSFVELSRLSKRTKFVLDSGSESLEISKRMLDAVQAQNSALMYSFITGDNRNEASYKVAREQFEVALADATNLGNELKELEAIYHWRENYYQAVSGYFDTFTPFLYTYAEDEDEFLTTYRESYNELNSAIKDYMMASQNYLSNKAMQLEENAYRAITPGIITLVVCIMIILVFAYLIDLYYSRPITDITRGIGEYLRYNRPFTVKMEGRDEVFELKEKVNDLIALCKRRKDI